MQFITFVWGVSVVKKASTYLLTDVTDYDDSKLFSCFVASSSQDWDCEKSKRKLFLLQGTDRVLIEGIAELKGVEA